PCLVKPDVGPLARDLDASHRGGLQIDGSGDRRIRRVAGPKQRGELSQRSKRLPRHPGEREPLTLQPGNSAIGSRLDRIPSSYDAPTTSRAQMVGITSG